MNNSNFNKINNIFSELKEVLNLKGTFERLEYNKYLTFSDENFKFIIRCTENPGVSIDNRNTNFSFYIYESMITGWVDGKSLPIFNESDCTDDVIFNLNLQYGVSLSKTIINKLQNIIKLSDCNITINYL